MPVPEEAARGQGPARPGRPVTSKTSAYDDTEAVPAGSCGGTGEGLRLARRGLQALPDGHRGLFPHCPLTSAG